MRTAHEIREDCEAKIRILQSICTHEDTSWAEEAWAPAHLTGRQIKYCKTCEKHLEYKGSTWMQEAQSRLDLANPNNDILNQSIDLGTGLE